MPACPCGSTKHLNDCCAIIHNAPHKAEHAEQIMRARFSAFVLKKVDLIISTYHSSANAHLEREQIASATELSWIKLEIIDAPKPTTDSSYSYVEFKAWFIEEGKLECLHERSRFQKELREQHLQWCYLDGEHKETVTNTKKVGRNDPCPCNSGKKYKKCCFSNA